MHFCNPKGPYNTAMSLECIANFFFCRKSTPAHRDKHAHIRDRGGDADLLSPIASVFYNDGLFHAEHQLSGGRGLPTNQLFPGKQVGGRNQETNAMWPSAPSPRGYTCLLFKRANSTSSSCPHLHWGLGRGVTQRLRQVESYRRVFHWIHLL